MVLFSSGGSSGGDGRRVPRNHHLLLHMEVDSSTPDEQQHGHLINMPLHPPLVHVSPFQHQLLSPTASLAGQSSGSASAGGGDDDCNDDDFPKRDERVVQWGNQETRHLMAIRAELEAQFSVAKRQKGLWELVAAKLKDFGYFRTADQCKCKWKNLVLRFKGKEASDPDNHHELLARRNHMPQLVHKSEAGPMQLRKRVKRANADVSSSDFVQDSGDDVTNDQIGMLKDGFPQNRRVEKGKRSRTPEEPTAAKVGNNGNALTAIQETLRSFFQQQQSIDAEWRESLEKQAQQRMLLELEWQQRKEKLERERIMHEQALKEREEQRKAREEVRADKREALLTILLKKLVQENGN